MRRLPFLLLLFLMLIALSVNAAQARQLDQQSTPTPQPDDTIQILSPQTGQALQGSIPVIVNTTLENFQTVELTFGYAQDPSQTWFLIKQGIQPVTGTMLALWDTGMLTDGDYNLRMEVTFKDSSQKSVTVTGLRVRNYSPIETNTPLPPQPTATAAPARTPTFTPPFAPSQVPPAAPPSPTPLARNPAELDQQELLDYAIKGVLIVVGLFAFAGMIGGVRRLGRKN